MSLVNNDKTFSPFGIVPGVTELRRGHYARPEGQHFHDVHFWVLSYTETTLFGCISHLSVSQILKLPSVK